MNRKLIGIGVSILLVIGGVWAFMIISYKEDVGTNNIFIAEDSDSNLTIDRNNSLLELSFSKADESLEWSKLSISIENETEQMDCSKGDLTTNQMENTKVSPKLSSDGVTFSVIVDATSEDKFTYVNLENLMETDETKFDMRFSKTDIYLSSGITGTIVEDTEFEELVDVPNQEFTETSEERLDWYDYKAATHRIEVEDKIYVINIENRSYKIKFVSYYNEKDEGRHVSFLIGALNKTTFPALSNPDLVAPAKCTIIEDGKESFFWEIYETITISENDYNICSSSCSINIIITYEGVPVKGTQKLQLK